MHRRLVLILAVLALMAAACGDEDAEPAESAAEPAPTQASPEPEPEPAPEPEPEPEPAPEPEPESPGGEVWYLDVTDANPIVAAIAQGINDRLVNAGYTMIRTFALNMTSGQLDLTMQSQGFDRALAASPEAVAYFLLDPTSLKPQAEQAAEAGIPVFAAFGKPVGFDVNGFITLDDDQQGYLAAKYLADNLPAGAKVAVISGPPTPNVEAEVAGAMRALEESDVEIVGDVENQRNLVDNAAGGQEVMQGIIQQFPDVDAVFVYNDDSVLGAIAAAKAAGLDIKFTSRNGSRAAVEAVMAGDLLATCDIKPVEMGAALGDAIIAQIEGEADYRDNAQIPSPDASGCLVTADNADQWIPWNERIEVREIAEG